MAEIWWISWLFTQYWRILETCVNYIPIVILEMNMSIEGTVEVESSGRSLTLVSCPCLILFHSFPFCTGHVRISTLLFFMSWRLSPTCLAQARFLACLLCTYGVSIFLLKPPIAFVAKSLCGMEPLPSKKTWDMNLNLMEPLLYLRSWVLIKINFFRGSAIRVPSIVQLESPPEKQIESWSLIIAGWRSAQSDVYPR